MNKRFKNSFFCITLLTFFFLQKEADSAFQDSRGKMESSNQAALAFITVSDYSEFLNSEIGCDPYHLYDNDRKDGLSSLIIRSGEPGNYHYEVNDQKKKEPMNSISWLDAARYCNWKRNTLGHVEYAGEEEITERGIYRLEEAKLACVNDNEATFLIEENEAVDPQLKSSAFIFYLQSNLITESSSNQEDHDGSILNDIFYGLLFVTATGYVAKRYCESSTEEAIHDQRVDQIIEEEPLQESPIINAPEEAPLSRIRESVSLDGFKNIAEQFKSDKIVFPSLDFNEPLSIENASGSRRIVQIVPASSNQSDGNEHVIVASFIEALGEQARHFISEQRETSYQHGLMPSIVADTFDCIAAFKENFDQIKKLFYERMNKIEGSEERVKDPSTAKILTTFKEMAPVHERFLYRAQYASYSKHPSLVSSEELNTIFETQRKEKPFSNQENDKQEDIFEVFDAEAFRAVEDKVPLAHYVRPFANMLNYFEVRATGSEVAAVQEAKNNLSLSWRALAKYRIESLEKELLQAASDFSDEEVVKGNSFSKKGPHDEEKEDVLNHKVKLKTIRQHLEQLAIQLQSKAIDCRQELLSEYEKNQKHLHSLTESDAKKELITLQSKVINLFSTAADLFEKQAEIIFAASKELLSFTAIPSMQNGVWFEVAARNYQKAIEYKLKAIQHHVLADKELIRGSLSVAEDRLQNAKTLEEKANKSKEECIKSNLQEEIRALQKNISSNFLPAALGPYSSYVSDPNNPYYIQEEPSWDGLQTIVKKVKENLPYALEYPLMLSDTHSKHIIQVKPHDRSAEKPIYDAFIAIGKIDLVNRVLEILGDQSCYFSEEERGKARENGLTPQMLSDIFNRVATASLEKAEEAQKVISLAASPAGSASTTPLAPQSFSPEAILALCDQVQRVSRAEEAAVQKKEPQQRRVLFNLMTEGTQEGHDPSPRGSSKKAANQKAQTTKKSQTSGKTHNPRWK